MTHRHACSARALVRAGAILLSLCTHALPALAQHPAHAAENGHGGEHLLPPASTTGQSVTLAGRTLRFTATAGSLRLTDAQGDAEAEIGFTAYRLDGADPATRPVTFAINGGPGMASAWLQLGAIGPWRLPMDGGAGMPSAAPTLQGNDQTWLDFTDLVFLDPVGTGYSHLVKDTEELRRRSWSVDGDIDQLARSIRLWLERDERLTSPKYIVGESYGGFRAPRLVRALETDQGVGVRGLVLVSPALDLGTVDQDDDPLWYVAHLPSQAAAARAAIGPVSRATLADVEEYATGDYIADLLRGVNDAPALDRISARVAGLTGLDPALVRRHAGRIDTTTLLHEEARSEARIGSAYDATVTRPDPDPAAEFARVPDPILASLPAPLTSAVVDLYERRLNWRPDTQYRLFNAQAARAWDWGAHRQSPPQALDALRTALALDPGLRVVVAHGLTDQVTPYFGSVLLLRRIPDFGPDRIRLRTYPGGHMFYIRDASRAALRDDAAGLIAGP